jgi:glucose uptake protein
MFTISDYSTAVWVLIFVMLCWGSWPNTQRFTTPGWRFELYYWDYIIGLVVSAILIALTFGSMGSSGRHFLADLQQAGSYYIMMVLISGILFNTGNLLFVAAINFSGMAVTFPVGCGLGLVIGVVSNYWLNPLGDGILLFTGVLCILLAMFFTSKAYQMLNSGQQKGSNKGIWLAVAAGCFFGVFFRLLAAALATNTDNPEPGKLTPYTVLVIFTIGALIGTIPFNSYLMRKPWQGAKLSFRDYVTGTARDHVMGMLGGTLWCIGLIGSLLASAPAGSAIAFGLSQGNAMIASLWGVLIWKEFRQAGDKVNKWLVLLFICYLLGLTCMILSGTV